MMNMETNTDQTGAVDIKMASIGQEAVDCYSTVSGNPTETIDTVVKACSLDPTMSVSVMPTMATDSRTERCDDASAVSANAMSLLNSEIQSDTAYAPAITSLSAGAVQLSDPDPDMQVVGYQVGHQGNY
jgi:hypothetical protein